MPTPIQRPDTAKLWAGPLPPVAVDLANFRRVSQSSYSSVVHFGRGAVYRFDDPMQGFGVLYAGSDYMTCVSESILRDEVRQGARPLYKEDLDSRVIANLSAGEVNLVDLTDALELGLDNQISTTPDYGITQDWARALYLHPSKPDGLYYLSRNYPKGAAIALFDRVLFRLNVTEAGHTRVGLRQAPEYKDLLKRLQHARISLR
jgi:hypothetical protein